MQMSVRFRLLAAAAAGAILTLPLASLSPAVAETAASAELSVPAALASARIGDVEAVDRLLAAPATRGAERLVLQAQAAAMRGDRTAARGALDQYWQAGGTGAALDARALQTAADIAFAEGRFREAADAIGKLAALKPGWPAEELDGIRQSGEIAAILAAAPGQRVETRGSGVPAKAARDKVGLIRTAMTVSGISEEAVIDTGAALSVASASAAKRLGLRMLEGDSSVGNALRGDIAVKLAVADRIEVAGVVLRDVPFLVLADEALTFPVPGGYTIDTIIGLPVLRAMGSIRFGPGETIAAAPGGAGRGNLRLVGTDPYVMVAVDGAEMPLFLDTGANQSALFPRSLTAHPLLAPRNTGASVRKAGAGGSQEVKQQVIDRVVLAIGGGSALLDSLAVDAEGHNDGYGVLGNDIFRKFDSITIDFDAMSFSAGAPTRTAEDQPRPATATANTAASPSRSSQMTASNP